MGIDGIPVVHDGSRGVVGLIEDVVADHRNIGIGTEIVVLSHDIRLTRCHEIEIPDGVIAAHAGVAGQYVEARAAEQAAAGVDRGPVLDLDADIIASKVVTLNLDCRLVSLDADARAGVNVVACDNGIAWRDKEEGDTNIAAVDCVQIDDRRAGIGQDAIIAVGLDGPQDVAGNRGLAAYDGDADVVAVDMVVIDGRAGAGAY